jgi:ribosomal protein L11 methyltransferase
VTPRFFFLLVDVAASDVDSASALLFELGATGIEERDEQTLEQGPGRDRVTLVASFDDRVAAESARAEVDRAWAPRVTELVGDAWRDAWKRYFAPFRLTDRITIRPPWEAYEPRQENEIVLELEPGRAFGTGLHATTALVARALEARTALVRGARVLDVGTGSGILALVACALGAAGVRAIDIDGDAVAVARENIARNAATDRVQADATPLESLSGRFEIALANIEARALIDMAGLFARVVTDRGLLVLSGILDSQATAVQQAYAAFSLEERLQDGEWVALALRHASPPRC